MTRKAGQKIMLDDVTRGWVAGVLDMHGRITNKNTKARPAQVSLYVESRAAAVIGRLCALTGTTVEMKAQSPLKREFIRKSCTEHCPEAHVHAYTLDLPPIAKWTAGGCALAVVLWNVHELLRTDEEPWQWAMARTMGAVRFTGQGCGVVRATLRRLDGLGWEIPGVLAQGLDPEVSNAG